MANNNIITKRGVSHQGTAMFARLKKTEVINGKDTGKYTLMLALDKDGQQALWQDVQEVWNAFIATPEMQGKTVQQHWNNGFKKYKDVVYAKFGANAHIKTRQGDLIDITIPVFDGAGNPLDLQGEIGNGSVIKVAYDLYPYYMSQAVHGVSLRLKAVQVLDLKVYNGGANASSFGFSTDGPAISAEAVVQAANVISADENPFPAEYAPDDIPFADGDF